MKIVNSIKITIAAVAAAALTACSGQVDTENEIQIPIYEQQESFRTVQAQYMDLEATTNIGASIGFALSDALSTAHSGNLVSVNVEKYQYLSEGDVIAVIDSSSLNYTYLEQEIVMNAAYAAYVDSGTEEARLNYEYEKAKLDAVQYQIDSYTITAPYDCIVTDVAALTAGTELEEGTYVCSVAYADDIYVYVGVDTSSDSESKLQLGSKVGVTLTGSTFEGTVVSIPEKSSSSSASQNGFSDHGNGGGMGSSAYGGPTSADSSKYAIIGFEPDVLKALLEETPNAVIAAWATVTVTTDKMCNVLCVPSEAITSRESTYVYLYQDGQKLQTPVQTGAAINGYTVILSGLKDGDMVIV